MVLPMQRPAFTARSLTLGTLFTIVFGTLWVGNGLRAFQSMQTLFLFAALAVVTTTLLAGRSELMLPMIVLSVGLYLLALAPILSLVHYYIVGALLCLLPIGTVLLVPATIPLAGAGDSPGTGWLILVGLIGGSIQFGLASVNLSLTVSLRRRLRAERTPEGAAHG